MRKVSVILVGVLLVPMLCVGTLAFAQSEARQSGFQGNR